MRLWFSEQLFLKFHFHVTWRIDSRCKWSVVRLKLVPCKHCKLSALQCLSLCSTCMSFYKVGVWYCPVLSWSWNLQPKFIWTLKRLCAASSLWTLVLRFWLCLSCCNRLIEAGLFSVKRKHVEWVPFDFGLVGGWWTTPLAMFISGSIFAHSWSIALVFVDVPTNYIDFDSLSSSLLDRLKGHE